MNDCCPPPQNVPYGPSIKHDWPALLVSDDMTYHVDSSKAEQIRWRAVNRVTETPSLALDKRPHVHNLFSHQSEPCR